MEGSGESRGDRKMRKCSLLNENQSGQQNQSPRTHLDSDFFVNPGTILGGAQGLENLSIGTLIHPGLSKATV